MSANRSTDPSTDSIVHSGDDLTEAEFLARYDAGAYERPSVTVDMAVFTIREGRLAVLLVLRGGHPFRGRWALPGGFIGPDESAEVAAGRELAEECGAELAARAHLEALDHYTDPDRDPRTRVISLAYVAFVPDAPDPTAGDDAAAARFWILDDLVGPEAPELAFDHDLILADAVERVRSRIEYTTLAATFLDEPFTIAELRRIYEAIWGVTLDPANFHRKVRNSDGFVIAAEGRATPTLGRPAALYRRGPASTMHPPILRPDPT